VQNIPQLITKISCTIVFIVNNEYKQQNLASITSQKKHLLATSFNSTIGQSVQISPMLS
jgi:hypothetical protein